MDKRELLEHLTDEQLAALVGTNSQEAFALLMARCEPIIRQQAARFRTSWMDAEDLAQEGLLGLYFAARSFRPSEGTSFRTYASVCIRNRMITAAGRLKAGSDYLLDSDDTNASPAEDPSHSDPAQLLVEREEAAHLQQRLRQLLTDLEYQVLMGHLSGYSYKEIADQLHVSIKSVDNALQRARKKSMAGHVLESP